jgi:phospholipase C
LNGFQDRQYDLRVYGPNGFLRVFRGGPDGRTEVAAQHAWPRKELALRLENGLASACTFRVRDPSYGGAGLTVRVEAGSRTTLSWPAAASHGWYDLEIGVDGDAAFYRRLSGHLEDGLPSRSDPAFGAAREQGV